MDREDNPRSRFDRPNPLQNARMSARKLPPGSDIPSSSAPRRPIATGSMARKSTVQPVHFNSSRRAAHITATPLKSSKPLVPFWQEQDASALLRRKRAKSRSTAVVGVDEAKRTSIGNLSPRVYVDNDNGRLILKDRNGHPVKSARKRILIPESDESDSSSDSEIGPPDSDLDIDSRSTTPVQRGWEHDATPHPTSRPDAITKALKDLVAPLVVLHQSGRLPFLLWNVRQGFLLRCHREGVDVRPTFGAINVIVQYNLARSNASWTTQMAAWCCPFCNLHGRFDSRAMLHAHLEWDHSEFPVEWSDLEEEEDARLIPSCKLDLWIPSPDVPIQVKREALEEPFVSEVPARASPLRVIKRRSPSPAAALTLESLSIEPLAISRQESLPPSIPPGDPQPAETPIIGGDGFLLSSHPVIPPRHDPLGPAARYPFLPAHPEDDLGGQDILFSCRPGGPKVYDLIATLPMEPYGLGAWQILDREEEIFEGDEMKDEFKAMHALWGRWIVLNRNEFIADFFYNMCMFVDSYWRMIHRACGFGAFRYWALMMHANRYLTPNQMILLLRRYKDKTGMDTWYKDSGGED